MFDFCLPSQKPVMPKLYTLLTAILFFIVPSISQAGWDNKIYKESIRTVEFRSLDKKENYPVIRLNSAQKLYLHFDDLNGELSDYQYTIVHCDYNWQPSNLMQNEYIDGVFFDYIVENETSFNTYITYTHYSLEFPNDNARPKISGNYVLKVYEDGDEENVVLTRRFFVYQPSTIVRPVVHRPVYTKFYDTHHEVDVTVQTAGLKVMNVMEDFKLTIMQNGRWDNAVTGLKPRFLGDDQLEYNYEDVNVFQAGNEFRQFDSRNVRFGGRRIAKVLQDTFSVYNAFLHLDKGRSLEAYNNYADFNGYTLIEAQGVGDENVEGDYTWVHFKLLSTYELEEDVYVFGAFTNWELGARFKMTYNSAKRWYECKALLKQGFYNYIYVVDEKKKLNLDEYEGNFYQTENDYQAFFYMYSIDLGCDLLVGYGRINSVWGTPSQGR